MFVYSVFIFIESESCKQTLPARLWRWPWRRNYLARPYLTLKCILLVGRPILVLICYSWCNPGRPSKAFQDFFHPKSYDRFRYFVLTHLFRSDLWHWGMDGCWQRGLIWCTARPVLSFKTVFVPFVGYPGPNPPPTRHQNCHLQSSLGP